MVEAYKDSRIYNLLASRRVEMELEVALEATRVGTSESLKHFMTLAGLSVDLQRLGAAANVDRTDFPKLKFGTTASGFLFLHSFAGTQNDN